MTFDKRLEAEAEKYASMDRVVVDYTGAEIDAFEAGAHWSREETLREVIDWLRSDEADELDKNLPKYGHTPMTWAGLIERRFLAGKRR